ncbi:MAG: AzlD domain-containing protein [Anaerolineae bacterium]|nr:AzlD domain-containing protein [Anaerolineae bacterium]
MNEVILIVGMVAATFLVRYPVLALLGKVSMPEPVLRALRYVPPAVLTAIIVPEVLMPGGQIKIANNAYLIAAIVAMLISWRTKSLLLTIILGMATLWLWYAIVGI